MDMGWICIGIFGLSMLTLTLIDYNAAHTVAEHQRGEMDPFDPDNYSLLEDEIDENSLI